MQLQKEHIQSAKDFIAKIPESIVKSKYETWVHSVEPTMRATSEQLEEFSNLSLHLPLELQPYPKSFVTALKNELHTAEAEKDVKAKDKTDLVSVANESISDIKNESKFVEKTASLKILGDNDSPEKLPEPEIVAEPKKVIKEAEKPQVKITKAAPTKKK